jgi:ubiquinone/menaquinone biosynthesis C-methylase UbiE
MASNTEWQVSGDAAQRYEAILVPTIFVPWAETLLQRAVLRRGENLLDLACGTGIVARMATETLGPDAKIVGVDINKSMLSVARAIAPEVYWIEAGAEALPLPDRSFDAVICQQGLQFFPDRIKALGEVRRVLKPGGRAVFCVARALEENPFMSSQAAALGKHLGEGAAAAIRAVCALSDKDEIAVLFRKAGFTDTTIDSVTLKLRHPNGAEFVRNAMTATPAADAILALDDAGRDALVEDALAGFGECYDGKALTFPHAAHVIVARV